MIIRPQLFLLRSPISPKPLKNPSPKSLSQTHRALILPLYSHLPNAPTSDSGLLFREKIIYLQRLNVDSSKALSLNPDFRAIPIAALKSVEKCFTSMGIERAAIGRILDMHPQLLTADPYADLYPIFDFLLNDVKIPFPDIRNSIVRCPRLLICSVDNQLRPTLRFLRDFGFVGANAVTCQTTLLLVSSVEGTLVPKIEYLESLGFSYDEVVRMVLRSPGLLTFSIEKNFRPKVEYFLEEMKGDLSELKSFPQYFSFSLEGKIKPRHRRLIEHGYSLSLPEMLKVSDGEFNVRLIEMRLQSAVGSHESCTVEESQRGVQSSYELLCDIITSARGRSPSLINTPNAIKGRKISEEKLNLFCFLSCS